MKKLGSTFLVLIVAFAASSALAQNHLSVTEQLRELASRFPGGATLQTADLRYEVDERARRAQSEGRVCFECMGVQKIDIKQIGPTDDRTEPVGVEAQESSGVGIVVCQNPEVNGGRPYPSSGSLVARYDVVAASHHAFNPEKAEYDSSGNLVGRTLLGRYDFRRDCSYRLYRKDVSGSVSVVFESRFITKEAGRYDGPGGDEGGDWAVLRLARKVPQNIGVQPFRAKQITRDDVDKISSVVHFSYSHKGSETLKIRSPGKIQNSSYFQNSLGFVHTCDTNGVSSGGPMTVKSGDGHHYLIGIHTGAMANDFNSGIRLDGDFYNALSRSIQASDRSASI